MIKKYVRVFLGIAALLFLSACAPTWAQAQYRQQPGYYQSADLRNEGMFGENPSLNREQIGLLSNSGINTIDNRGIDRNRGETNWSSEQEANWEGIQQNQDRYGYDNCVGEFSGGNGSGRWQVRGYSQDTSQAVSFRYDVQPILNERCISCHGGTEGIYLDTYDGVMNGSRGWQVIIPGDPSNSYLIRLVSQNIMPFDGPPLTQSQVQLLADWISTGAPNN
jgi:hypothetical protein